MNKAIRSIWHMLKMSAETITMVMAIINSLARSGVERAVVVEGKSINAAALSELDNANEVAIRLKEITDVRDGISPEAFNQARVFLDKYREKRNSEITGTAYANRTIDEKTPEVKPKK